MRFDVITLFPKMFDSPFEEGLVAQAIKQGSIELHRWDLRNVTSDKHKTVDDRPFGGGDGMVLLPEVLKKALDNVLVNLDEHQNQNQLGSKSGRKRIIYLSPQGTLLTHKKAQSLAREYDNLILICGRYAGIDERFIQKYVDEEISVGDYIVTGGELPAMILMDAVSRFVPGTLGNEVSANAESFQDGLLEEPQYTRPRNFEGLEAPEVLTSGHHERIQKWKAEQRVKKTLQKRPDLMKHAVSQSFSGELQLAQNVAVGLVHYPVYNKAGQVVATNVTNLDIHDIARACRTFGIEKFYIITPMEEQLAFVGRVLEHWQSGRGMQYNPVRSDSLINVKTAMSIQEAFTDWNRPEAKLVATSARHVVGPQPIDVDSLRVEAIKKPLFLLFGTGWGLENGVVRDCQYLLEPIRGRAPDGFKHLSVRSAVSIILDRLFGPCY